MPLHLLEYQKRIDSPGAIDGIIDVLRMTSPFIPIPEWRTKNTCKMNCPKSSASLRTGVFSAMRKNIPALKYQISLLMNLTKIWHHVFKVFYTSASIENHVASRLLHASWTQMWWRTYFVGNEPLIAVQTQILMLVNTGRDIGKYKKTVNIKHRLHRTQRRITFCDCTIWHYII